MHFIGITGGVGAGKSKILKYIEDNYNAVVIRSDELAQEMMLPGHVCYPKLKEVFGQDDVWMTASDQDNCSDSVRSQDVSAASASKNMPLDRKKMAALIYRNPERRKDINNIVHPMIRPEILKVFHQEEKAGRHDFFFLEAALLIEEHYDEVCDELWYIYADEDTRRKRLKASRGYSDEKISSIFQAQLSEDVFRKKCSVVIDNSGSLEKAFQDVDDAMAGFKKSM